MKPEIIEYLKTRIVSAAPIISGEITTHTIITLDNGDIVEGCAVREINNYEKAEADNAAFMDAIKTFAPGINLALHKAT